MDEKNFEKVLSVLENMILAEQARLGRELAEKKRLRGVQLGISADEKQAFDSYHGFEASDALTHALNRMRVQKLRSMQTDLQPDLARAALRREKIKDDLKRLMRQKLAMQLCRDAAKAKLQHGQDKDSATEALFQMMKRI